MHKIAISIKDFFSRGHERTIVAKRNIAATFLIKGGSILISLILVPLTIHYLNPLEFGIWLTISSFITWFAFFDIGFGSGLKNKLAIAIALNDYKLAKIYVSTTYFMLAIISAALLLIFYILNFFLNWTKVLNAPHYLSKELNHLAIVVFSVFAFQFVLQLINVVIAAKQNAFVSSIIGLIGNLLSLAGIYILSATTKGTLVHVALVIGLCPLFVSFIFSVILYKGAYKKFAPSFKAIKLSYAKDLMGLGIKFFIIQLGLIFFYNVDNLIITNVISPQAVTSYNIAFKYFSIITMVANIVMTPIWPAFTEAYAKEDHDWIKLTVNRLLKFCFIMLFLGIVMLAVAKVVYKVWIGKDIVIPFSLSACLLAFTAINTYRTIFCYYLNGIGKIVVQLYGVMIAGLLNIPLGIIMGKMWGTTGVILATTLLCVCCAIVETIQYRKLIRQKATGIWNR